MAETAVNTNETNGLAVGALIASLVGFSLPGLIMGYYAFKQTRRTGQKGDGLALAAIWIGGLGTAFWTFFMAVLILGIASAGGGA